MSEFYEKLKNIKFRKYQKDTIERTVKAFIDDGYTNVVIEAPTGFGKSLVNYCIAKILCEEYGFDAWYTTPQISLLEQLENDRLIRELGGISIIKGKDKYYCPYTKGIDGKLVPVKYARCNTEGYNCPHRDTCPYEVAKWNAIESDISAMSFAFMILTKDVEHWGERELLIVDEADDLESWAVEFGTLEFTTPQSFTSIESIIRWAKVYRSNVMSKLSYLEDMPKKNENIIKQIEYLTNLVTKLSFFIYWADKNPEAWTFIKKREKLIVKPVDAGIVLGNTIWNRGIYRLITSATIIDVKLFKKYTGLKGKTLFIRVPNLIPADRRRVVVKTVGKMTKEKREETYDALIKEIVNIINKHKGEKGIVHAHSYEIANEIRKRLNVDRKIITHDSYDRERKLKEFMDDDSDSVFVCVGFERGLDLKYDLARFQIITKVPYPDISDIRVKELWLRRKDWRWARYQAIKTLVQACGRIVRAEDDYGVTYILDSSIEHLLRYKKEFPSWFLEAVVHDVGLKIKMKT